MRNLLKGLHLDHELISARIGRLKKAWLNFDASREEDRRSMLAELRLLHDFLKLHHLIEEQFLFPALLPYFTQVQSGAHCSRYMMQQITDPPLLTARNRAHNFGLEPAIHPGRIQQIAAHNSLGSFLSIPLEEHEAGAIYFELLLKLLSGPGPTTADTAPLVTLTLHSYLTLLESHVSKEENCLFPQCEFLAAKFFPAIDMPEETYRQWAAVRLSFGKEHLPLPA